MRTILAAALLLFAPRALRAQDTEAIEWAETSFPRAFDIAFPVAGAPSTIFARTYHDVRHSFPEYSLAITYDLRTGRVRARLREARDVSVFVQLQRLHRAEPAASVDDVAARLQVEDFEISDLQCRSVRADWNAFGKLRFGAPPLDVLVLHPVVLQIRVEGAGSLSYDILDLDHPIARWVRTAAAHLRSCRKAVR